MSSQSPEFHRTGPEDQVKPDVAFKHKQRAFPLLFPYISRNCGAGDQNQNTIPNTSKTIILYIFGPHHASRYWKERRMKRIFWRKPSE